VLIDFSPDIRLQILENKIQFNKIKSIVITHTHSDHLDIQELIKIKTSIDVFINKSSYDWLLNQLKSAIKPKHHKILNEKIKHIKIVPMQYFESFYVDEFQFIPIKAKHSGLNENEVGMNFIIQTENIFYLHATDTGVYSEKTFNFIKKFKFTFIVIECTFLDYKTEHSEHLNLKSLEIVLEKLKKLHCITKETPIILTHFAHEPMKTHEEIEALFKKNNFNIKIAYDTMEYFYFENKLEKKI
jgi:phosphoribosyl 1,2-cyclic phosphate phosphodiesterase